MKMQAKHIPAVPLVNLIAGLRSIGHSSTYDIAELFPEIPIKVLRAKLRNLYLKGFIEGCYCGCSTHWYVVKHPEEEITK